MSLRSIANEAPRSSRQTGIHQAQVSKMKHRVTRNDAISHQNRRAAPRELIKKIAYPCPASLVGRSPKSHAAIAAAKAVSTLQHFVCRTAQAKGRRPALARSSSAEPVRHGPCVIQNTAVNSRCDPRLRVRVHAKSPRSQQGSRRVRRGTADYMKTRESGTTTCATTDPRRPLTGCPRAAPERSAASLAADWRSLAHFHASRTRRRRVMRLPTAAARNDMCARTASPRRPLCLPS